MNIVFLALIMDENAKCNCVTEVAQGNEKSHQ